MAINPAFLGHGIWLELNPLKGLQRYADYKQPLPPNPTIPALVDRFIEAVQDMKMSSVWLELFTRSGVIDKDCKQGTKELVDGLKAAGIKAVPWGYCYGANSERADPKDNDLALIQKQCDHYKLDVFCADIEPWNESPPKHFDVWSKDALSGLLTGLKTQFGQENIGISSFANLKGQPKAAEFLIPVSDLVSFCAPQIYWNGRDPVKWAVDSLQSWRDAGVKCELVATTQSYWAKQDNTPSQSVLEAKLASFVQSFPDAEYKKIVGLNWYHAGGPNTEEEGGMSQPMIDAISAKRLDLKPYRVPNPPAKLL